jgi:hypothetical protein
MSDERVLRNGWKVRYVGENHETESHTLGEVHGVGHGGFSVRFDDGISIGYPWRGQDDFSVLSRGPVGDTHDSIAQDLLLKRLNRGEVEVLLARYRAVLAADLAEIHDDPATPERYRAGMRAVVRRLHKAADL